jgi:oligoendopeptidase F
MNLLPFENLPPFKPRTFVPAKMDWGDWNQIAPLYDELEARVATWKCEGCVERWLLDWSELNAALDQDHAERYIAMTCHTDNADAEKGYLHIVEHVQPQLKSREFKLAQLFVAHPLRHQLPKARYEVFDRNTALQVELFRPENVPLETEEARLGQQYQKLNGSLTVQFRGEEKTLIQMGRYLEEPDRAVRQEAWELVANRRLQTRW